MSIETLEKTGNLNRDIHDVGCKEYVDQFYPLDTTYLQLLRDKAKETETVTIRTVEYKQLLECLNIIKDILHEKDIQDWYKLSPAEKGKYCETLINRLSK